MRGARLGLALLCWLVGGALAAEAQTSVNHATTCTGASTPSTSDIDCPAWMADHVFTGGAQGYMLYRDTGEANGANWTDQIRFDETLVNLGLFGGTIGTDGSRVLSVSCASSVAPTTTPADTVQWWCEDIGGGPGTAGAVLRTEPDGGLRIRDGTQTFEILLSTSVGVTYVQTTASMILGTIGIPTLKLSFGETGIYNNFHLGDPDTTVGTNGAKVLLHTLGTGLDLAG